MSRSCYEMSGHSTFHHFKSPICEVADVHQVEHCDKYVLLWWHRCSTSLRRYCRPRPHHGQWVGSKPQSRGMIGGGARICCWASEERGMSSSSVPLAELFVDHSCNGLPSLARFRDIIMRANTWAAGLGWMAELLGYSRPIEDITQTSSSV